MDPLLLILLLVGLGAILLIGDLFLPSAGMLSVVGIGLLLTAVIFCFTINRWLGLGVLFAGVIGSPLIWVATVRAWQRTPVGRRMVLSHAEPAPPRPAVVRVGQVGRTLSALRPMGECAFATEAGEAVVECRSEFGDLAPGTPVRVSHFNDGVATVRPAAAVPPPLPPLPPLPPGPTAV